MKSSYYTSRKQLRKDHKVIITLLKNQEVLDEVLTYEEGHRLDMLSEWIRGLCNLMDEFPDEDITLDTKEMPMTPCTV